MLSCSSIFVLARFSSYCRLMFRTPIATGKAPKSLSGLGRRFEMYRFAKLREATAFSAPESCVFARNYGALIDHFFCYNPVIRIGCWRIRFVYLYFLTLPVDRCDI